MSNDPETILTFWLGSPEEPLSAEARKKLWWGKDPELDRQIKERFGPLLEAAGRGELSAWRREPRSRLALILLIDQLSRNMHRGTPGMYALDHEAQDLVLEGLLDGAQEGFSSSERCFFYMPLMHAENVALQRLCVRLFAADPDNRESHFGYAEQHAAIVERFGRFPHRNAILGRASTEEELAFLKESGSSF